MRWRDFCCFHKRITHVWTSAADGGALEARQEAGVCEIAGGLKLLRVEQTEDRLRWIMHCRAGSDALKTARHREQRCALGDHQGMLCNRQRRDARYRRLLAA
jgi:hypothetical protein